MAIRCPGCGRNYDEAIFALGRTIDCACGRRVGAEPQPRPLAAGGELRFIADAMLGRLARWLRILGFDTVYEVHIDDADVVRRALSEERIILSRDRRLPQEWHVTGIYLLEAEQPLDQLREVTHRFGLGPRLRPFTRCSRCNAPLVPASRDEARDRVPSRVLSAEDRFTRCPDCDRFYWRGSHVDRVRRIIGQMIEPSAGS